MPTDGNNFSPINVDAPDFERYPKFRDAEPIELTIGPGELLFVPRLWPHHVRSLDFSASLNCFCEPASAIGRNVATLMKGAIASVYRRLGA